MPGWQTNTALRYLEQLGFHMRQEVFRINGFIYDGKTRRILVCKISNCRKSDEIKEYYCEVYADPLLKSAKKIYGIDEEQTLELSKSF